MVLLLYSVSLVCPSPVDFLRDVQPFQPLVIIEVNYKFQNQTGCSSMFCIPKKEGEQQ